jgi:hypothetical protein
MWESHYGAIEWDMVDFDRTTAIWTPLRDSEWAVICVSPPLLWHRESFCLINYHTDAFKPIVLKYPPTLEAQMDKVMTPPSGMFQLQTPDSRILTMHSWYVDWALDHHEAHTRKCAILITDTITGMVQSALLSDRRVRLGPENTIQLKDGRIASPLGIWDHVVSNDVKMPYEWVVRNPGPAERAVLIQQLYNGHLVVMTRSWDVDVCISVVDVDTGLELLHVDEPIRGQSIMIHDIIPLEPDQTGDAPRVALLCTEGDMRSIRIVWFSSRHGMNTRKLVESESNMHEVAYDRDNVIQLQDGRLAVTTGGELCLYDLTTFERTDIPAIKTGSHIYPVMHQFKAGPLLISQEESESDVTDEMVILAP